MSYSMGRMINLLSISLKINFLTGTLGLHQGYCSLNVLLEISPTKMT
jgi:hypothetical protein